MTAQPLDKEPSSLSTHEEADKKIAQSLHRLPSSDACL